MNILEPQYIDLGCWKDTGDRAIPTLEGKDPILDGGYKQRKDSIKKCSEAARKRGYAVFAVQNGVWCASSSDAESTYAKYGASDECRPNGEGGRLANRVYQQEIQSMFVKNNNHAIQVLIKTN